MTLCLAKSDSGNENVPVSAQTLKFRSKDYLIIVIIVFSSKNRLYLAFATGYSIRIVDLTSNHEQSPHPFSNVSLDVLNIGLRAGGAGRYRQPLARCDRLWRSGCHDSQCVGYRDAVEQYEENLECVERDHYRRFPGTEQYMRELCRRRHGMRHCCGIRADIARSGDRRSFRAYRRAGRNPESQVDGKRDSSSTALDFTYSTEHLDSLRSVTAIRCNRYVQHPLNARPDQRRCVELICER